MTQLLGIQSIPQIFCQLNQLSHVELQYSSTLHSYQVTTKLLQLIKENIRKQISNRFQEIKYFTTQQGIGLRKIMLEHYEKLFSAIMQQHNTFNEITLFIYKKHKSMENSLNFIEPIVKQMEHKSRVLEKQLSQVQQKLQKIQEKRRKSFSQSFHLRNFEEEVKNKMNLKQFQALKTISQKEPIKEQILNQPHYSLFSLRKFDKFQTETQFEQVESFLNLKLIEVKEFIKVETQLTKKTVQKIFEIFDQTLGKGLQKLEIILLNCIKKKNINESQSEPALPHLESNQSDSQQSSTDLRCYETMEQILQQQKHFQKIKHVKKRLYLSSQIDGVELTQSIEQNQQDQEAIEVSPTFNCVYPLILQSGEQINQFTIKLPQNDNEKNSIQKVRQDIPNSYIYDSFSKENFNTMNN